MFFSEEKIVSPNFIEMDLKDAKKISNLIVVSCGKTLYGSGENIDPSLRLTVKESVPKVE